MWSMEQEFKSPINWDKEGCLNKTENVHLPGPSIKYIYKVNKNATLL